MLNAKLHLYVLVLQLVFVLGIHTSISHGTTFIRISTSIGIRTWYSYFNFPWHTMAPLYPSLRSRKIFCRRKRKLRRSKSRIQYYPNSTASFQLLRCAGDIELNPGPDSDSTRLTKNTEVKDPTGQILIYFQYVATCQVV